MPATDSATDATVPEIFDRLASKGQVAQLRRTSGAYEFDFDGGGHWFLVLDHGTPSVQPKVEHPTCTVHCPAADFVAIAEGKENMITAYLRGDLVCAGNLAFALTFRHLIPVAA
jgi:putative sterol carrier protein